MAFQIRTDSDVENGQSVKHPVYESDLESLKQKYNCKTNQEAIFRAVRFVCSGKHEELEKELKRANENIKESNQILTSLKESLSIVKNFVEK